MKEKAAICVFLVTGLLGWCVSGAFGAGTDPRVCSGPTRLQCGKDAATQQTIGYINAKGLGSSAVVTCRGYKGLLRYRCTWRNALGNGAVLVTYSAAPAFAVTVKSA